MNKVENTKYFEVAQMVFLLGTTKKNPIVEKHKFMTMLFFLNNPLFLEKLCLLYRPNDAKLLQIKDEEKYNLLYEEERISLWHGKNDLLLSYLLSRELASVEVNDKGYSFTLTPKNGLEAFNSLKKDKDLKTEYTRAKILNKILGLKEFSEIKQIIIDKFEELSL